MLSNIVIILSEHIATIMIANSSKTIDCKTTGHLFYYSFSLVIRQIFIKISVPVF